MRQRRRRSRGLAVGLAIVAAGGLAACREERPEPRSIEDSTDSSLTATLLEGRRQLLAGDARAAEAAFDRALTASNKPQEAAADHAVLGLGDVLTLKGFWAQARTSYEQASASEESSIAEAARARLLWLDARNPSGGQDREAARELFDRGLDAARALDDRWLEVRIVTSRADLASFSRDPEEVLPELEQAFAIADQIEDVVGQAATLRARGQIRMELGQLDVATGLLTEALVRLEHPSAHKSRVLQDLGILHFHRGEMVAALTRLRQAAQLSTELPHVQAYCLGLIGTLYGQQGNYPLARQAMEQALATFEELKDRNGQVMALENLAHLSTLFDRTDLARDYFARSLPLHERVSPRADQAGAWLSFGRMELAAGHLEGAKRALFKSRRLAEESPSSQVMAEVRLGLGELRLHQGDAAGALELLRPASEELPQSIAGRVLVGRAQRAVGATDVALKTFHQAVLKVEEQMAQVAGGAPDQELFLNTRFDAYGELVDLLVEQGEIGRALAWAERGRAHSLLAVQRESEAARSVKESELREEEALIAQLAELNQQRVELQAEAESRPEAVARVEDQLQRTRLELETLRRDLLARLRPRPMSERREPSNVSTEGLAADTLVLEFLVLESKTLLFALWGGADGSTEPPSLIEIPMGATELASRVDRLRRHLAERHPSYAESADQLYRRLLAPVEQLLHDAGRIGWVPDGPLWDLPLQVLGPTAGEALVDRYDTFAMPSLRYLAVLAELRPARASPPTAPSRSVLAVGNPTFSETAGSLLSDVRGFTTLGELPDAEREAQEIAALYGPGSEALIGSEATEARIKADAHRFGTLHFAAHALLDDGNPAFSALVLAPGSESDGEDGLLEGWEVAGLGLDADLVVLAGCQTHRGRLAAGRGLMGLSWAFARAGSPTILASHWEVDSAATRRLMVEFHRRRSQGENAPAALRHAALALRQDERFQHPFYWAGFSLVGDPGEGS